MLTELIRAVETFAEDLKFTDKASFTKQCHGPKSSGTRKGLIMLKSPLP